MSAITTEADYVWRDGPEGSPHRPVKAEIRAWARTVDNIAGAASDDADRAEAALAEIEEIAAGAPDAPSIVNKANKNGDNITAKEEFRQGVGLSAGRSFSIMDYGALPSMGSITAAFDLAIADALAAGGGVIYFPAGDWFIDTDVASIVATAEQNIQLSGEGLDQTRLIFGGTVTRGIMFRSTTTSANRLPRFCINDMTLCARIDAVDWAVDAEWAIDGDIEDPFSFHDAAIQQYLNAPGPGGFGYFKSGIRVKNARNSNIYNFRIGGERDRVSNPSNTAISLEGECTSFKIDNGLIIEWVKGQVSIGTTEGVFLTNVDIIACDDCVIFEPDGALEPQLTITGGTLAGYRTGAKIRNCRYIRVVDTFILCKGGVNAFMPSQDWIGVDIDGALSGYGLINADFSKEDGQGSGGKTSTFVKIATGTGIAVIATGNGYQASDPVDVGVALGSGASNCTVMLVGMDYVTAPYTNAGTGNLIQTNASGKLFSASGFSSASDIDMTNGQRIRWRNAANTAWLDIVNLNVGNNLVLGLDAGQIINSKQTVPIVDNSLLLGNPSNRWFETYSTRFRPGTGAAIWTSGSGTPEGAVTAVVGSMFTRTDGGAGSTLYVKESGTGNTGWVAK